MYLLFPDLTQIGGTEHVLLVSWQSQSFIGVDFVVLEGDSIGIGRVELVLDPVEIQFCGQIVDLLCLTLQVVDVFSSPPDDLVLACIDGMLPLYCERMR